MARYEVFGNGYDGYSLYPVKDGLFRGSRIVVELSPREFKDFKRVTAAADAWHKRLVELADDPANVEYGLTEWEATNLAFEHLPRKSRSE